MKAHKVNFSLASDGMDKVNLMKVNFDLVKVKFNLASDGSRDV